VYQASSIRIRRITHRDEDAPGPVQGPVLVSEKRRLTVPLGHPYARRATVSRADDRASQFDQDRPDGS
jgi:hypothetical protein